MRIAWSSLASFADMDQEMVRVDGAELFVRSLGPSDGQRLMLLHGWPDTGDSWLPVAEKLSDRFRLIIPDNRGFGRSSMPEGTDAYKLKVILRDVVQIAQWAGWDRFGLCGHDFGGPVAWGAGMMLDGLVDRIAVIAAPHPLHWKRVAAGNAQQMRRSFYVWLMNVGPRGEALLAADDFRLLAEFAFGGLLSESEMAARRANWAEPGRFTAMAEWYRAGYNPDLLNPDIGMSLPPVVVPTLYVHGRRDWAFEPELAEGNGQYVKAEYQEWLVEDGGHWLQLTHCDALADRLADWFSAGGA